MKTSELQGAALDWAVHTAQGLSDEYCVVVDNIYGPQWRGPEYSTSWQEGGPIIDRFRPQFIQSFSDRVTVQKIDNEGKNFVQHGPTLLVAAMRCFVASKLGEEVDIPEELQ
jgi:hypothetical protein